MKKFIIERATMKDLPMLVRLQNKQAAETRKFANDLGKKGKVIFFSEQEVKKTINSPQSFPAVAKIEGKIVGCGFVKIEKARPWSKYKLQGYLGALYVEKKYRRQGIASALQKARIEWVRSKGIRLCATTVLAKNTPALNLQKKAGFKPHDITLYKELKL